MIDELKEIVERSMREHDLPYERKQSLIWGISTTIGFLITQLLFLMALDNMLNGLEIFPFWFALIGITAYISRKVAGLPEVKSYFSKLYSDFWKAGFFAIAVISFLSLLLNSKYTGAFIAPLVGTMICISGIMFKVRYTVLMGIIYSASAIVMLYFWQYQFLVFAIMQFMTLAAPNISAFSKD